MGLGGGKGGGGVQTFSGVRRGTDLQWGQEEDRLTVGTGEGIGSEE